MTPTDILVLAISAICALILVGYWLRDAKRALDAWLTKRTHSLFTDDPSTQGINHAIAQADADLETARAAALRERAYWYGSAPPPSRAHHHRKPPVVTTNGGRRIHAGNVIPLRQAGGQDTQAQP